MWTFNSAEDLVWFPVPKDDVKKNAKCYYRIVKGVYPSIFIRHKGKLIPGMMVPASAVKRCMQSTFKFESGKADLKVEIFSDKLLRVWLKHVIESFLPVLTTPNAVTNRLAMCDTEIPCFLAPVMALRYGMASDLERVSVVRALCEIIGFKSRIVYSLSEHRFWVEAKLEKEWCGIDPDLNYDVSKIITIREEKPIICFETCLSTGNHFMSKVTF